MFKSSFISLAVLVLVEASPLALQAPHPNTLTATPQISNSSNSLNQSLEAFSLECDRQYGDDLQYTSCDNVANHQMLMIGPGTFAPRGGPGKPTYPTPAIYVSKDGLCFLEIFQTSPQTVTEDARPILVAAQVMLEKCVRRGGGQGAIARGLGRSGQLGVIMRSYHPSVTCRAPLTHIPLVPASFEYLSNAFPASRNRRLFGAALPGESGNVGLPWQMQAPWPHPWRKATDAIVRSNAASDHSSWYDIYVALISIWSMCGAAEGRGGIAANIGEGRHLSVELREVVLSGEAVSDA